MGQLISLENVTVDRGGHPVLRGVTLDVEPERVVGVAGPNGSGKTTLLRLLATLLQPSSGNGRIFDADLGSDAVYEVRRHIAMISHTPAVIPELTLRENLVHATRLAGVGDDGIDRALRAVGLDAAGGRTGGASSHGMLRRIEVARILLTNPRILLLDEAFSGLDSEAQVLIGAIIDRTCARGGCVVIVSHDVRHLQTHASDVLLLSSGRLEVSS